MTDRRWVGDVRDPDTPSVMQNARADMRSASQNGRRSVRSRRVGMVAFDDFQLLDLAGPVEVFNTANLVVGEPRAYDITVATPDGGSVRSASGIEIGADTALSRLSRTDLDVLMVVGGLGVDRALRLPRFVDRLRAASRRADLTTSVCTGASALAAAGLLDGYQATTHWASCDAARPTPPRRRRSSPTASTSTTATAGPPPASPPASTWPSPSSRHDHGAELAHAVAGWLVVFVRRPGGQAQFSAQLRAQAGHARRRSSSSSAGSPDHLDDDLSVDAPGRACRHEPADLRPDLPGRDRRRPRPRYVEALRIEAARRLLETTDLTVAAVARPVGLAHAETLHRAFRRRVGTTPDRYRQHFARGRHDAPSTPTRPSHPTRPPDLDPPSTRSTHADRHRPLPRLHRPRRHRALPGPHQPPRRRGRPVRRAAPAPSPTTTACSTSTSTHTFDDVPAPDVAARARRHDHPQARPASGDPIVDWIRSAHETTTWTTSVCTGALLLGAAGVLDGLPATTHWIAYDAPRAATAPRPPSSGSSSDGKVVTAAGVSAGIDLALTLVGAPRRAARWPQAIQLGIEYDPQPPFDAGAPSKARPEILQLVRAIMTEAEATSGDPATFGSDARSVSV